MDSYNDNINDQKNCANMQGNNNNNSNNPNNTSDFNGIGSGLGVSGCNMCSSGRGMGFPGSNTSNFGSNMYTPYVGRDNHGDIMSSQMLTGGACPYLLMRICPMVLNMNYPITSENIPSPFVKSTYVKVKSVPISQLID